MLVIHKMDNLNVFNRSIAIMEKARNMNINDSCIKFANGEVFLTNKLVLSQLELFKNIFTDLPTLSKINGRDIVLEIDEGRNFINEITFDFFYERLKRMYFPYLDINKKKLKQYQEQRQYILLLDYLTNPGERQEVLYYGIVWHDLFWVSLLSIKFPNICTFFDRSKRTNGYIRCSAVLNCVPTSNYLSKLDDKEDKEVYDYFMLDKI